MCSVSAQPRTPASKVQSPLCRHLLLLLVLVLVLLLLLLLLLLPHAGCA